MLKTSYGLMASLCLFALSACTVPAKPSISATSSPVATITPRPIPVTATASPSPTTGATNTPAVATVTPSPVGSKQVHLNEPFTLKIGEWSTLEEANNTRILFTGVLQDTRCPQDVNCYQAGSVRVAVTVESEGKAARFDLSSLPSDYRTVAAFNGYVVRFVDLGSVRKTAATPIPPDEYTLTLRVNAGSLNTSPARFNEPFTLKLGQSTGFVDSNLRMTFEAVKQDSRCPLREACTTSGAATVGVRLAYDGVNQEQMLLGVDGSTVMTSFPIISKVSGYVRVNALTPYPQQDTASKEISPKDYEATFVIVNPVAAPRTVTPNPVTICPDLAQADAEAILGEAVRDQPAALILFPPRDNSVVIRGLCGYGSAAFTPGKPARNDLPRVLPTTVQSDHAVIAGKLTDNRRLEQLLSIATAIDAANPPGPGSLYLRILTEYSAGAWSRDLLGDFPAAARGAANVRVSKAGSLGESAIWVWREFDGGRYAALAAQKGDTLFVITALTGPQRTEDALFAAMSTQMQTMLR